MKHKTMLTAILVFSVIVALISSCANSSEVKKSNKEIQIEMTDKLWQKVNSGNTYKVVFLGDSITYAGDFEQVFSEYNCVNLGVAGDFIEDVRNRKSMACKVRPQKLFLMVGINSLHCIDTDVCARQYEALIKDLKLDLPTTKIYIESVLPTANIYGEYVSNDAINMFNQKLIALAEKYKLEYIDLNSLYKDGQELNILYTFDGIHLTPSGYFLWYEKIREYL